MPIVIDARYIAFLASRKPLVLSIVLEHDSLQTNFFWDSVLASPEKL